jgi:hypothetical protein
MPLNSLLSSMNKLVPDFAKHKRRQRRVRFNLEKIEISDNAAPPLMKELTIETVRQLWYSQGEILTFKQHAKAIVLHRKQTTEDTSGFERFDITRAKYKKTALHYVLLSQKVQRDPEFQSYISRRCTARAKIIALNQGLEDFCEVYDPLISLLGVSNSGDSYNDYFFNDLSKCADNVKRPIRDISFNNLALQAEDVDKSRRVRQRTLQLNA